MRQEKLISLQVCLILAALPATVFGAESKLDSSQLSKEDAAQAKQSAPKAPAKKLERRQRVQRSRTSGIPELSQEDENQLKRAVQSFTLILGRTRPGPAADMLTLNRAQAYLSLAQKRIYRSKSLTNDAEGKKLIHASMKDARVVASNPQTPIQKRARAYYLLGLGHVYLDQSGPSIENFLLSIKIMPKAVEVPWMAFYIAEEYFEAERYQDAIQYYREYRAIWEPRLRRMGDYKTAWALINLNQVDQAQEIFIQIYREQPTDDAARDALRDLAYLSSKFKSEDQILEIASRLSTKPIEQKDYLKIVYGNITSQATGLPYPKLLTRLLEIEKSPEGRIELFLASLTNSRKEFAARSHFQAFERLRAEMGAQKIRSNQESMQKIIPVLDIEIQKIIKSFVETFSGRIRTPETFEKAELSHSLKQLFAFYQYYVPRSPIRETVYTLWFDVCGEMKDWMCIYQVSHAVLREKTTPGLNARGSLERIAALEELIKMKPGKYEDELLAALTTFTRVHVASPRWLPVAKRLTEAQLERKKHGDAVETSTAILKKEPTQENFYRLQWARLLDERYEEILKDPVGAAYPGAPHPKLKAVIRETSLQMALRARKDGDVPKYSAFIKVFLESEPDSVKAALARRDYLSFLLEKEVYADATRVYLTLPPAERDAKDAQSFMISLTQHHMKHGQFAEAIRVMDSSNIETGDKAYLRALARAGMKQPPDLAQIAKFPKEKREYLVAVFALTQPQWALAYFKQSPPQNSREHAAAFLALRLTKKTWDFLPTKSEAALIGDQMPPGGMDQTPTRSELTLQKIKFPEILTIPEKANEKNYAGALERIIQDVRYIRGGITRDIKGRLPIVQLRILTPARELEDKVGQSILNSPMPKGLEPLEFEQYNQGLKDFSKEFLDQAAELEKLEKAMKEQVEAEQKALALIPKQAIVAAHWPWPNPMMAPPLSKVKDFLISGNALGALLILDLNREKSVESDEQYHWIRAGVLLSQGMPEVMNRYVFDELTLTKQDALIHRWRSQFP